MQHLFSSGLLKSTVALGEISLCLTSWKIYYTLRYNVSLCLSKTGLNIDVLWKIGKWSLVMTCTVVNNYWKCHVLNVIICSKQSKTIPPCWSPVEKTLGRWGTLMKHGVRWLERCFGFCVGACSGGVGPLDETEGHGLGGTALAQ